MKFIYFLLIILLGFALVRYEKWIVDNTGMRLGFAENFLGPGGTHSAMKLLGVLAIIFAFYYMFSMP